MADIIVAFPKLDDAKNLRKLLILFLCLSVF